MDKVSVTIRPKQAMSARIPGVKVIDRGGTTDYNLLRNRPSINEHVLTGGENTLESLGIGRASMADINKLF